MLSLFPGEVTSRIVEFLEATDVHYLWACGDTLMQTKLAKAQFLRSVALPHSWPSSVLRAMPRLSSFHHKYHPLIQFADTCKADLLLLPKTLTRLTLPSLDSWDTPLSLLCPSLESITLNQVQTTPINVLLPLPTALRFLEVSVDAGSSVIFDSTILRELPASMERLHIRTTVMLSVYDAIRFPMLKALSLRLPEDAFVHMLQSLPSSLEELDLRSELGDDVSPYPKFWTLIPPKVTKLYISGTTSLFDMPLPEQLNPALESFNIELFDPTSYESRRLPRSLEDYWKALPSLTECHTLHVSNKLDLRAMPKGYRSLELPAPTLYSTLQDVLPGSSITTLSISATLVTKSVAAHSLPPTLTSLNIMSDMTTTNAKLDFRSFPDSLEVLSAYQNVFHPEMKKFPPKLKSLTCSLHAFPPGLSLEDLPLDIIESIHFTAHSSFAPLSFPYPSLIERNAKFPLMPNLTSLDMTYTELTESYATFARSIPSATPLLKLSVRSIPKQLSFTAGADEPVPFSPWPAMPKTLRSLSIQVSQFDPTTFSLLPKNLFSLHLNCIDDSLAKSIKPEHLKLLPSRLSYFSSSPLNLTSEDWQNSGLSRLHR